jgi:hypothetical protein
VRQTRDFVALPYDGEREQSKTWPIATESAQVPAVRTSDDLVDFPRARYTMIRNARGFWGWGWGRAATAVDAGSRSQRGNRHRLRPELSQLEGRQLLSNLPPLMVSNTNAVGPGSLRRAINTANLNGGDDTIKFSTIVFNTPQTISIGRNELLITDNKLTIIGPAAGVTVSGVGSRGNNRILELSQGASAVISHMTISGGYINTNGGGILNKGDLTLNNCTVSNDTAHARSSCYGGGLYNQGKVTLNNCTFSNDTVIAGALSGGGGGLYNGGTASVTDCTFSNDTAKGLTGGYGGGIYTNKRASLVKLSFSNNNATFGPNIYTSQIQAR